MNRYDCEAIRDLLPALLRGELLTQEAAATQQHLDGCAPCRAEADIVRLLQSTLAPIPAGLEARVLGAVRRRRTARFSPGRLALAATLAAAVLGGALIFGRDATAPVADMDIVSWAAAEDPLLHGASELHDLSVEELEVLLEELDR